MRIVILCLAAVLSCFLNTTTASGAMPPPPGVVVWYSPPTSGIFIGTPGIAVLHDGAYLMKCDEFGPHTTEWTAGVTRVFRSTDKGKSWKQIARLRGMYWSNIFEHQNAVYMIGVQHDYGPLVVMKSTDEGVTWTTPTNGKTGLIRAGRWHTSAVPIIEHDGRLWRAVESCDGPLAWGTMFRPHVMSIPMKGNLLDANEWTITNTVQRNGGWLGGKFKYVLEGNAVYDRITHHVLDILRANFNKMAAVATVSDDGKQMSINPKFEQMPFRGAGTKFEIRWDQPSHQYFALSNPVAPMDASIAGVGNVRNTLALFSSPDLRKWTMRCVLLNHPDAAKHAFQYPDWTTVGDDLLVTSRTGWDSPAGLPDRGHDADYLTFHRFTHFRELTMKDGVQLPQPPVLQKDAGGLHITGHGFKFATLNNGVKTFTNRNYVWMDVPAKLQGATITMGAGGFRGNITVGAMDTPRTLMVFTAGPQDKVDLSDFKEIPSLIFNYTDGAHTSARVYERTLAAGEKVTLPEGNWVGVHVLVPTAQK